MQVFKKLVHCPKCSNVLLVEKDDIFAKNAEVKHNDRGQEFYEMQKHEFIKCASCNQEIDLDKAK